LTVSLPVPHLTRVALSAAVLRHDLVVAGAAGDLVAASPTVDLVAAAATGDVIVAVAACQIVGARTAAQRVVAGRAAQVAVERTRLQHVCRPSRRRGGRRRGRGEAIVAAEAVDCQVCSGSR